ncbi:MAG TPA: hypothetical protein VFU25_08120 [Ornithinibacter sp.]|nr:hypothetical protein [Ornithinibacter sp.]
MSHPRIHRILGVVGALAAAAVLTAAPAMAGNAHFIANLTTASASGTDLVVQFKESGLESGSVETVQVTAHLDATYQCINNGGTNPNDPKKTTISAEVSASGQFTAGKNGTIKGSLSVSAPAAADVLDCPNGQRATLTAVTWSDISISDLTSGAFLAVAGTFSSGSPVD